MKIVKPVIYLAFLIVCFQFFGHICIAAGPTVVMGEITSPTIWTKDGSPYKVSGNVVVKAPLTVEAGTVVKFGTGGLDGLKIQNDFFVNGTKEEPVVFTSLRDDEYGGDTNGDGTRTKPSTGSWLQIMFNPVKDCELKIKYAKILYANFGVSLYPSAGQTKEISIKKSEIRKNGIGINISNADALIESNVISENTDFGIVSNVSTKKPKAINNSISNNASGAKGVNSSNPGQTALEAKYNWWGAKSGPYNEFANPDGSGNPAKGQISFNPWMNEDPIQTPDPVIVIPGIMGSWEKDGKWKIDPIFHTYDNLCEEFLANGYEDGKNFFVFPYQWRNSNIENAKILRDAVNVAKEKAGRPKVDIVAHSMGGLLAREYIESNYYESDIDQLITLGTPHNGAPKAYLMWEAGEFVGLEGTILKYALNQEAKENGYSDLFNYIHNQNNPILSLQELLPTYNYLYDVENDYTLRESYPNKYPRNEFLENLNKAENISVLNDIDFTKIIGKQNRETSTISGFSVVDADMGEKWEHGYPHGFEIPWLGDQGIRKSDGDGTVPLISAEAGQIPANRTMPLQSEHNALPTDAQKDVLEILSGKRPENEVNTWLVDDILMGLVFSPVDIQIESPSGKKLGKNFTTGGQFDEIKGAFYTGYDTNSEFLTIPNPEDGEYKILSEGTGTGEYKIEIVKISESDSGKIEESTATIEGTAQPQIQEEAVVKVEGAKVEKLTLPDPPSENTAENPESAGNPENFSSSDPVIGKNTYRYLTKIQELDILKNEVRQYLKVGQIKKRKTAKNILQKMGKIRVYLKRCEILEENPKSNTQKKITRLQRKVNDHIDRLTAFINRNSPEKISTEARDSLVEDLENLRID